MKNLEKKWVTEDQFDWYVALESQILGPLKISSLYKKLLNHEVSWVNFIRKSDESEWRRICDIQELQSVLPRKPSNTVKISETHSRIWYLYYQYAQLGPFSKEEVEEFYKKQVKKSEPIYGWRVGMENWVRLELIEGFKEKFLPIDTLPQDDRREEPRRPLVAKILMTNDQSLTIGVCLDISTHGLKVLSFPIPGEVGTKLKMNISPSNLEDSQMLKAHSKMQIQPIVAEGVIVRILEDGRGFSFKFQNLSKQTQKEIEEYMKSFEESNNKGGLNE